MRMLKKIIIALIIVCFPILLNCLLRIPITNVIGGSESDVIWLNFWADYGGAILGGFISLYILYATIEHNKKESKEDRDYNHNKFLFEQQKNDLEKEIERLTLFLQVFDHNKLKFIYNYRLKEKGTNESLHMLGDMYSLAFDRFHQFSIYYTDDAFSSSPFLMQQGENYISLIHLFDDLQILISLNPDNWTNKELQIDYIKRIAKEKNITIHRLWNILNKHNIAAHQIVEALLKEYCEISQVEVLSQIREYINERRVNINKSFFDKYGENGNAEP